MTKGDLEFERRRYYSVREAAEILGVSTRTIYRHIAQLGGVRVGKSWRIPADSVSLTAQTQGTTGGPGPR